jgi:antitoxin PrlF
MANKIYSINPAKIGNQDGFRLARSFFKDHPYLANASGYIEVLSNNTFLVKLDPKNVNHNNDEDEGVILSLFLDFLMKDAIQNPDQLVMYTQKMNEEIDDLVADVILD